MTTTVRWTVDYLRTGAGRSTISGPYPTESAAAQAAAALRLGGGLAVVNCSDECPVCHNRVGVSDGQFDRHFTGGTPRRNAILCPTSGWGI